MKYFIFLLFTIPAYLQSQNVGIGTATPDPSAKLEINSDSSGILIPRLSTEKRDEIPLPSTGLLIFNSDSKEFEFYNGSSWTSFSGSIKVITDADEDTRIEVEQNEDEDILRFTSEGIEIGRFLNNRLEVNSKGGSMFIGSEAGMVDNGSSNFATYLGFQTGKDAVDGFANTYVGAYAGSLNQAGMENTILGVSAGYNSQGNNNTLLGRNAGRESANGSNNTFIGHSSGMNGIGTFNSALGYQSGYNISGSENTSLGSYSLFTMNGGSSNVAVGSNSLYTNSEGFGNVAVGYNAGLSNEDGELNVFIGYEAGRNNMGTGNVFIGSEAGRGETENNKLYIANTGTPEPLIYGEFNNKKLEVNGSLKVSDNTIGTLDYTAAGTIRWNSKTEDFEGWTGTKWKSLTKQGEGKTFGNVCVPYTATQSQTVSGSQSNNIFFGFDISIYGNIAAIGSPIDTINGRISAGSVYIFTKENGMWNETARITATNPETNDFFGHKVELENQFLFISSQNRINTIQDSGSVFIYELANDQWNLRQEIISSDHQIGDRFGYSISSYENTLVVGAYERELFPDSLQGAAYIFENSGGTWVETQTITDPFGTFTGQFGRSVSIGANGLVVGSPNHNNTDGKATFFVKENGAWTYNTRTFINREFSQTGFDVDMDDEYAIIGGPYYSTDGGFTFNGIISIYGFNGSFWDWKGIYFSKGNNEGEQSYGRGVSVYNGKIVALGQSNRYGAASEFASIYKILNNNLIEEGQLFRNDSNIGDSDVFFGNQIDMYNDNIVISGNGKVYFYGN